MPHVFPELPLLEPRDPDRAAQHNGPLIVIVHLDRVSAESERRWHENLDVGERERFANFHFARDRRAFAAGRGVARDVLAQRLDVPASTLRFEAGRHGKPALSGFADAPAFNWAHSGHWIAIAFANDGELGVDVEDTDVPVNIEEIAAQFFSAPEREQLQRADFTRRRELFFRLWTLKEAFIKGVGLGMRVPLDGFHFDDEQRFIIDAHCELLAGHAAGDWHFWSDSVEQAACALAWRPARPGVSDGPAIFRFAG